MIPNDAVDAITLPRKCFGFMAWVMEAWDSRTGEVLMADAGIEPVELGVGPQTVAVGALLGDTQETEVGHGRRSRWVKGAIWVEGGNRCQEGDREFRRAADVMGDRVTNKASDLYAEMMQFIDSLAEDGT